MFLKTVTHFRGNPVFHQISSVHVKSIFDNCSEIFELKMETIPTQIQKKMMRKYKIVGVKPQNWAPELKNSVLSTVQKQGCH